MNDQMKLLKHKADTAKGLYRLGRISRTEAMADISKYLTEANKRAEEIAKRYGRKHKQITAAAYLR